MNDTSSKRSAIFTLLALVLVFMFIACGDGGSGTPISGNDPGDNLPPAVNVELECEVQGYPCSLAEVPDEILERSQLLADEALAMIESGASMDEVRAWLDEQDGMVEIMSDDLALRFRLEGGRGTWILRKEALADPGPGTPAPASMVLGTEASASLIIGEENPADPGAPASKSVALPTPSDQMPRFVVGQNTKAKNALVLSPLYWDFENNNDGAQVAAILGSTRGYEGRVTYRYNPTAESIFDENPSSMKVAIINFLGWGYYQVIHVESHGSTICEAGSCRAVLGLTTFYTTPDKVSEEEKAQLRSKGIEVVWVENKSGGYYGLSADFFRYVYPGGLKDTLVFFNACKSFGSEATDLANAIRGSTSVFLGWDGSVKVPDSNAASNKFYQELSQGGVTVQEAYNRLGDLQTDRDGTRLIRSPRAAGGDLRIRDIVYLLNPDTYQILAPSQEVSIVGEMDDGEPDIVPYRVRVDGILAENAADAQIYVSVDGIVSDPKPVSEGETGGPDRWIVNGQVDLPYDVEQAMSVGFEAWVELPEGGKSSHEATATLTGLLSGEGIVGTWVVDNASLAFDPQAFTLEYIQGEIRVNFRGDGSVEVVYDNHEYQTSDEDTLNVGGEIIFTYEEFTYTANASGMSTYEVNGDQIEFSDFFESSFVDGTQSVHHIKTYDPENLIGSNIDEIRERSYGGWGLFGGFVKFNLSPSGSTMQLLNGNEVTAILNRVGSAGG